jgi:transposase
MDEEGYLHQIAELRHEMHLMRKHYEEEITGLKKELLAARKEIKELKARLAAYENANTPPSRLRFEKKKENDEAGGKEKHGGAPPGHKGITRDTPTPDEIVDVTESHCPKCKAPLGEPTFVETKTIEDIPKPAPVKVTEFRKAHYDCPCCGIHVIAKHRDCPETGRFGANLQAEVGMMKFEERLTLRKICNSLQRRHGLKITPATILEILERAKVCLQGEYEKILAIVRTAIRVNADETTFKVNGVPWQLWVFRTKNEILFLLRDSRSREVVEEALDKNVKRILGCDGYAVYVGFGILQRCWAHLIRELEFVAEKFEKLAPMLKNLRLFFHGLKEKVALKPPPDTRKQIVADSKKWLERFISVAKTHSELKDFATYTENGMPWWFTFVEYDDVDPTNNSAEQALREQIIMRKIMGTLRNQRGTGIYEVLTSVFATWKARGLNPQHELAAALRS